MLQVPNEKKYFPLYLISFLDQIAITICFPVLTFICFDSRSSLFSPFASHAIRSHWFGILSAAPHIIAIFAAPLLCLFSDLFGRKKLLIIGAYGAVVFAFFSAIGVVFGLIALVLWGYILNGFCVRTEPIALSVIGDLADSKTKFSAMGHLQFAISLGAFIGPIAGGFLAKRFLFSQLNFSLPYWVSFFVGILTVAITIFYFKETHIKACRKNYSFANIWNKKIFKLSFILILSQICWRAYYQFVPPLLKINLNYSASAIGLFMGLVALWLIIASFWGIKFLQKRFSKSMILHLCLASMVIGMVLVLLSRFFTDFFCRDCLFWLSSFFMASGDVIIFCLISTEFSDSVSAINQGKIMGYNFILVSAVWAITGIVGGYLFGLGVYLPVILGLFSLGLLLANRKICKVLRHK